MDKPPRASVLLVDDNTHTLTSIARLLDRSGFHVLTASTADEALEILAQGVANPSFVILDQVLDGRRDGGTQAAKRIADLRQDIFIVMYTADPQIDQVEKWRAIHAGAHRFILKRSAEELLADFNEVIDDMHDLRGLTREIGEISRGRLSMFSALVGLDARLTIVDKEYRVWFSTDTEAKEAGEAGGLTSPCWLFFHGLPVEAGPCAGCSINAAIETGEMRSRIFLARSRKGDLSWVRNDTIPVFMQQEGSSSRRVIAAREACQPLGDAIADLTLEQKCRYAAESIIQAGFTAARVYRAIDDGQIRCVAAATCQPPEEEKVYLEKVVGFETSLERNRYMGKAFAEKGGTINLDWDPSIGPDAEVVFQFSLSPPWIDLPLWQEDNLVGWIGADLRKDISPEEAESSLLDLKDYGDELVRACFGRRSTDIGPTLSRPVLELARRELNRAQDAAEAIVAIMQLARSLVEEHARVRDVRIRVREEGRLRIINRLSPDSRVVEPEIFEDDPDSWAAYVVRFRHPLYVDNRLEYAERVSRENNLPKGKFLDGGTAIAILPLEIQGFCFGSLHIECDGPFNWAEHDLEDPLGELAGVTAILVRDIVVNRQLAEAKGAVERELRDAFGNLHGVRGPIQIVRNAFESILESHEQGLLDGDAIAEIVQEGKRATSRIERLARQLLRLSGSASRTATRLGLVRVLREFISDWRHEDIFPALDEAAEGKEFWIDGNIQNLREIFEEIMANAAQARAKHVTIKVYSSGNSEVVVEFMDDGVGIGVDKEEKIFERWYTEFPEGNGLGLTLVKTIVDHMGGEVWAKSCSTGLSLNIQIPLME